MRWSAWSVPRRKIEPLTIHGHETLIIRHLFSRNLFVLMKKTQNMT